MTVQNNISNQGKSFFKEFSIIRGLAQTETQPFVLQRRNQIAFISTFEEDKAPISVPTFFFSFNFNRIKTN